MARIIGQVESLKTLRTELDKRRISRFNSIGDINRFNREYTIEKQKILTAHEVLLNEEIEQLSRKIGENQKRLELLKDEETTKLNRKLDSKKAIIEILENRRTFFIGKVIVFFKIRKRKRELAYLQDNFDLIINDAIRGLKSEIYHDSNSLTYLSGNKRTEILDRSRDEIKEIDYAKKTIDELKPLIAGAIGESKVEKEIRKLSDDYILINDYKLEFNPPIYNKRTKDRIYSIQLDHLVVSTSGVFILETKNWSKRSINSLDLRSPVDQIMTTNYALRILMYKALDGYQIRLKKHHWGEKQIPIRNIIVMINEKPKESFRYVKIKLLKELNSYLEFLDPIFSKEEVESIANFLVQRKDHTSINMRYVQ